jgi:hypothetical protein
VQIDPGGLWAKQRGRLEKGLPMGESAGIVQEVFRSNGDNLEPRLLNGLFDSVGGHIFGIIKPDFPFGEIDLHLLDSIQLIQGFRDGHYAMLTTHPFYAQHGSHRVLLTLDFLV